MTKASKPVSAAERKAIGQKLKEARAVKAAKRDAEAAELAALRSENAALKSGGLDLAKRKEIPNESRDVIDDLAWIDRSVDAVWLVSKNMTLTLRPVNDDYVPKMSGVAVHHKDSGPWGANPFSLRSDAPVRADRESAEKMNEAMYANWGYFVITRQTAESVFSDPRFPLPRKAVISGAEFIGYDRDTRSAVGTYRDLGPAPDHLRETVRTVLQRLVAFVDVSRHRAQLHLGPATPGKLNASVPNPYRRSLGNLAQRLPPVRVEGATL